MEAFATRSDLAERWPDIPASLSDRQVGERLLDATSRLLAEMAASGVTVEPDDEVQARNLKAVCCQMVIRSLSCSAGVSQSNVTAGPYSQQLTFANPDGGLYINAAERRALGLRRRRISQVGVLR